MHGKSKVQTRSTPHKSQERGCLDFALPDDGAAQRHTAKETLCSLWKKPNEVDEASYICDLNLSPPDLPTQLRGQDSPVCGDAACPLG